MTGVQTCALPIYGSAITGPCKSRNLRLTEGLELGTLKFVKKSREMVKLLRGLRANIRYSEYDGVAHESWDRAYGEPELPIWLFNQRPNGQ